MTTDLWMLVATGFLGGVIPLIYATGRFQVAGGFAWAFGNRETALPAAPWVERAVRAHQNLTENLALFAILVITAHLAGKVNDAVTLGGTLFFWARVAHVITYTAGLIYWRTLAYFVGAAGELIILVQLLK
jgi:uncharacterized MAPEG superfamily protein